MSQGHGPTGPQFHADRPQEQDTVRTTIVGGRPPGSGQPLGNIPRGIEVLMKKAAVDPAFREMLLTRRADAADEIGLQLEPAEAQMLAAAPREQIEAIIAQTTVPEEHRRVFLGKAAAAMLIAVGVVAVTGILTSAGSRSYPSKGIRPDRKSPTEGIRPDRPLEEPGPNKGVSSERHEAIVDEPLPERPGTVSRGIRPDRPAQKPKSGEGN